MKFENVSRFFRDVRSEMKSVSWPSKDDLKEALFDALPNSAPNWTAQLGAACFQALFRQLETQLRAGVPAMITETAFWAEQSTAHFLDLKSRYRLEFFGG